MTNIRVRGTETHDVELKINESAVLRAMRGLHLTLKELLEKSINIVGDYLIEARGKKLAGKRSPERVDSDPFPKPVTRIQLYGAGARSAEVSPVLISPSSPVPPQVLPFQ